MTDLQKIDGGAVGPADEVLKLIGRSAQDPAVSVDKMERLFVLQREWEDRQAAKAAHSAMIAARAAMPEVTKDTMGQNSKYAKLEKVDRVAYPIYTKHGFSLQWSEVPHETAGWTRLKCVVLHSGGHREEHFLAGPMDDKGPKGLPNKTGVQGMGSTWSYLQRRLLAMIFNIRIVGEDNDGRGANPPQAGPSRKAATANEPSAGVQDAGALRSKLWAVLEPVRGESATWPVAVKWLQDRKIIAVGRTVSSLTPEELSIAIEKAEIAIGDMQ